MYEGYRRTANDVGDDWRQLLSTEELCNTAGIGGPSFLDAEGFRFHLPAYLIMIVQKYFDCTSASSVVFCLTTRREDAEPTFSLLSSSQCNIVAEVLDYLWEHVFNDEDREIEPEVRSAAAAWRRRSRERDDCRKPESLEPSERPADTSAVPRSAVQHNDED
jgi:hypothetical protein